MSTTTPKPSHVTLAVSRVNWRVTVEPRRLGDYGWMRTSDSFGGISAVQIEKEYKERCEGIAEQVKRHCDDVGGATVEYDTEYKCPHCGRDWNPDVWGYNGCCDTEMQAWAVAEWDAHSNFVRDIMGADWRPPEPVTLEPLSP